MEAWKTRQDAQSLAHLSSAEDTLVFCDAVEDQITHLSWLSMQFEAMLTLKINLENRKIFPVGGMDEIGTWLSYWGVRKGCRIQCIWDIRWLMQWIKASCKEYPI